MNNLQLGFFSILAGGVTSIIALGISGILDYFISYNTANLIGLLVAMGINFLLQKRIFLGNFFSGHMNYLIRYIFADIIIIGCNQLFFYMINKYKKFLIDFVNKHYYNLIWRVIISSVIWLLVSFPIRRYWVFKKNQKKKIN